MHRLGPGSVYGAPIRLEPDDALGSPLLPGFALPVQRLTSVFLDR